MYPDTGLRSQDHGSLPCYGLLCMTSFSRNQGSKSVTVIVYELP